MTISSSQISEAEKRESLRAALESPAFSRSSQLKALLRYICEMDIEGRAAELSEYDIAVKVLERPKDISPVVDSSVRNRVYELRQRLERHYAAEPASANIRISIPRGGYAPVWTRIPEAKTEANEPPPATPAAEPVKPFRWWPWALALGSAAVGMWAGAAWEARKSEPPAILREAWGPMAKPEGDVLICVANNLHMIVRQHLFPGPERLEFPKQLYPLHGYRPLEEGEPLFMGPADLSFPLGDIVGIMSIGHLLRQFGSSYQILPEKEAPLAALRGRNSILIGTTMNSISASALLKKMPFSMGFTDTYHMAVVDQRPAGGPVPIYVADQVKPGKLGSVYGLLTVMPSAAQAGSSHRTVIVSGTGSAGVQAALESYASPDFMAELKARFVREGSSGFPSSYQVVVQCQSAGNRLVSSRYLMHVRSVE
ncbi:MAG: hypothetical protein K2X03_26355 [Bryobacteraceae bacterium]|nr:hypothetical protein [Bryobacteraceae bacterium]